jgi:voltage-gated potassium channel
MDNSNTNAKKEIKLFNILILILSVYVLISLLVSVIFELSEELSILLGYIDNFICIVFLIDFWIRFKKADNKLEFMKWGWIDLIASIPFLDFARAGRVIRLIRLVRVFRALKSTKLIYEHIAQNKKQSVLTSVALISILMIIFSSIAILQFETDINSNIKTAEDAIWWSYVTITTVGYGDKYPITTEGRIIGAILMTTGVGIFGTFTALVSSWFMQKNED